MTDKYDIYEFVDDNAPVSVDDVETEFDITFNEAQNQLTTLRSDDLVELQSGVTCDILSTLKGGASHRDAL